MEFIIYQLIITVTLLLSPIIISLRIIKNKEDKKKSIETINNILNNPQIEITVDEQKDVIQSIAKIQTLLANQPKILNNGTFI